VRLPRNVSGQDLVRALAALGYRETRRTGSHIRLTTTQDGEHHVTIPAHPELRVGTLAAILGDVADHLGISREDVAMRIFHK
jgi:predicted RNA binding protein YcfA (HicA-like mRNA interferase family)